MKQQNSQELCESKLGDVVAGLQSAGIFMNGNFFEVDR